MTKAEDLKEGDKITLYNQKLTVNKIEVSKIAKHGSRKCRIEAIDDSGEKKVFIVKADEEVSTS